MAVSYIQVDESQTVKAYSRGKNLGLLARKKDSVHANDFCICLFTFSHRQKKK